MIFQRKKKNRRFEQSRILDVRLSSNQVRSARLRLIGLALAFVCGVMFVVFACWRGGEWILDKLVYENRAFAIQQINVRSDGVMAEDYLSGCSGIKPGANLFAVDLVQIRRNLEMVPWIKSARVERILPDTLKIRIVERVPVARYSFAPMPAVSGAGPVTNHLDVDGFVLPPMPLRARAAAPLPGEQYPMLIGLPVMEMQSGRAVVRPQVRAALRLIEEFDRSPMAGLVDLARIDVSAPDILICSTGQGAEAIFPLDDPARQLNRWRLVWDRARLSGKFVASIDLSISKNVPARLVDANTVTPVPPRRPNTPRTSRRHV